MSNQQIILSQDQKSGTVTLIFHNADFLAAVGDSLRVDSLLHVTINQSIYDEFVKSVMGSFVAEFMDFKKNWPIPQELRKGPSLVMPGIPASLQPLGESHRAAVAQRSGQPADSMQLIRRCCMNGVTKDENHDQKRGRGNQRYSL
ncbi:hypothetical protein RF11_06035 [Thelohanellus kitauei]|uniref:Uncharacterized protein n=4 Tax=cellular organisms TaxID=131567 RepID=A0A0C2IQY3_THEKT|nr:hypothetical protein RF11_06035 [Thelohanellus kitauei]